MVLGSMPCWMMERVDPVSTRALVRSAGQFDGGGYSGPVWAWQTVPLSSASFCGFGLPYPSLCFRCFGQGVVGTVAWQVEHTGFSHSGMIPCWCLICPPLHWSAGLSCRWLHCSLLPLGRWIGRRCGSQLASGREAWVRFLHRASPGRSQILEILMWRCACCPGVMTEREPTV